MKALIASVDCSTQSTKVVVVDSETGEIVGTALAHRILSHGRYPKWLAAHTMT
jgi:sugar (pentulose or hexulose) kinase